MLTCANQQETNISWFAGILEGEGSFSKPEDYKRIQISNTNLDILNACEAFLKKNYIHYTIYDQKRLSKKHEYTINISSTKAMLEDYNKKLYDLIKHKIECRDEFGLMFGSSQTTRDLSVDLNWLIGIFEAEGSFSIVENNRNIMAFKIDICNTNMKILQKVANNLHALGCSWHVESKIKGSKIWKDANAISIHGMKKSYRFLIATRGRWIAKRNQQRTELMIEFIESRFRREHKAPYSDREYQIVILMKQLNQKGG